MAPLQVKDTLDDGEFVGAYRFTYGSRHANDARQADLAERPPEGRRERGRMPTMLA